MKQAVSDLRAAKRLLKQSIRKSARGKRLFQESGDAFDQALALGVPIGEPITLRGVALSEDRKSLVVVGGKVETQVVLRDGLRNKDGREVNSGFTNARFQRFKLEPFKEPKPIGPTPRAKKIAAEMAATVAGAEVTEVEV